MSDRGRQQMVEQLREQGVGSEPLLRAMGKVPRHRFVEEGLASRAYEDVALPIGQGQTISKPSTVARMIQLLVQGRPAAALPGLRVLEIGTGCGYQAAVLASVFGDVVSIERMHGLHEIAKRQVRPLRLHNLRLLYGDGMAGVPAGAPYDAIISAAAGNTIPDAWLMQMQIDGRLVAPVCAPGGGDAQSLHVVERIGPDHWTLSVLDAVRFVPLREGTMR